MKVFSAIREVTDICDLDDAGEPIVTYCFRYARAGSETARSLSWLGILQLTRRNLTFLLIMCLITGLAYFWEKSFYDRAVPVMATVTGYQEYLSSDKVRMYRMEVEYITQTGRRIRVTEDSGSNMKFYDIGDRVEVYYNPKDPTDFRSGGMAKFLWTKMTGGPAALAVFFVILGAFKEYRTQNFTKHAQFYSAVVDSIIPTPMDYNLVSIIAATPANMRRRYNTPAFSKTPTGLAVGQAVGIWVDPKLAQENYAIVWQPDKWAQRHGQNHDNASAAVNSGSAIVN